MKPFGLLIVLFISFGHLSAVSLSYFWNVVEEFPKENEYIEATLTSDSTVYEIKQYIYANRGVIYSDVKTNGQSSKIYRFKAVKDGLVIEGETARVISNKKYGKGVRRFQIGIDDLLYRGPYEASKPIDSKFCDIEEKSEATFRGVKVIKEVRYCEGATKRKTGTYTRYIPVTTFFESGESMPIAVEIRGGEGKNKFYLRYDIIRRTKKVSDSDIQLPVGFGAPQMVSEDVPFVRTKLSAFRFHLTTYDPKLADPVKREIIYDRSYNFMRSESLTDEEAIVYDFRLGIQYEFETVKQRLVCQVNTLKDDHLKLVKALFVSDSKNVLIDTLPPYKYFGRAQCDQGTTKICDHWEISVAQAHHEGIYYDLLVITFRAFMESNGKEHIPYSIEIKGLNLKEKSDVYEKVFWRKSVISGISDVSTATHFKTKYSTKYCYDETSEVRSYDLILEPITKGRNVKTNFVEESIRNALSELDQISILRIPEMVISTTTDKNLKVSLLVVPLPNQEKYFASRKVNLEKNFFVSLEKIRTNSALKCMSTAIAATRRTFAYCDQGKDSACALLFGEPIPAEASKDTIKCTLYQSSADNVTSLWSERPIGSTKSVLGTLAKQSPFITDPFTRDKYKIVNYFDSDHSTSQIAQSFSDKRLSPQAHDLVHLESSWTNCLSKCKSSELAPCSIFSYCPNKEDENKGKCFLSSSHYTRTEETSLFVRSDEGCTTHVLSSITAYNLAESGRIAIKSSPKEKFLIATQSSYCADICLNDNDCHSFAICDDDTYKRCLILKTPDPEVYPSGDKFCTIYKAKTTSLFNSTTETMASDVFSTYEKMPFKKCAELCRSSRETVCRSFNYCEKSNECQLASGLTMRTRKSEEQDKDCLNYQYTRQMSSPSNNEASIAKSQSGPVVGIIFAFIVIGLVAGFAGVYGYKFLRGRISGTSNYLFAWHRQQDNDQLTPSE